jgi:hypothetical protein
LSKRAFLLIADIGGYTRFMKVHRINLSHAQYVVAQLLEAVIDAATPALELSKLEGDAALFYGTLSKDDDVARLAKKVVVIQRAFLRRRTEMESARLCSCDGCVQAGQLSIKFVAHEGEIAFQKIKRHKELAGVDVILVHRLLKNDVPVTEYMLMTEPVHACLEPELQLHARPIAHDLEGLGPTPGFYIDLGEISDKSPIVAPSSFWAKLTAWFKMTWRSIPYFLGFRTPCEGFRNLDDIHLLPPPSTPVLPSKDGPPSSAA